ncbi:hypothetical protein [Streptomyces millisiae]|uniref:Lipoprotein n=1 Tax=Streptomyces millisiae TaxID=3075542 RepID=A0ABU2LTI9_9ACTN|nr:hypothetical protein [Streptomyces sp. DSM 44918]MDT0320916.1 hypothetical protein [Streptomyces sp. DSM 44918]
MRKSIRLALPAVAASLALALTACGGDDESNGNDGGSDNGASETTGGGEGEEAADDAAGGEAGGEGPTAEELEGAWLTGVEDTDAVLTFTAGAVNFTEDTLEEGDICTGSYAPGAITLDECTVFGSEEWADREATVALNGETLTVTWASGTTQEYTNMMGDLGDLGDLGGDLSELEDSLAELEDLEAELGG